MDPVKALAYLAAALKKGAGVREEIITEVNSLSSAISSACIYTSMRLNQALLASSKEDKLNILTQMHRNEIESHARMNDMCAPIFHAANELKRFYSNENLHRGLGRRDDLLELLEDLRSGERGLQHFMMEFMDISNLDERTHHLAEEMYKKNSLRKVRRGERVGYKIYPQQERL